MENILPSFYHEVTFTERPSREEVSLIDVLLFGSHLSWLTEYELSSRTRFPSDDTVITDGIQTSF